MLENNNAVLAVVDPVYPGTALRPGSSGSEVARMQTYLNGLRDAKYPTLNRLVVDGRYGSATASTGAVRSASVSAAAAVRFSQFFIGILLSRPERWVQALC